MKGFFEEKGVNSSIFNLQEYTDLCQPPVDDADIVNMSVPSSIGKHLQKAVNKEIIRRDSDNSLATAGFALNSGPDGSGLWMIYLSRGGGYYIDVGASQLVADIQIKIRQEQETKSIQEHSIVLTDDSVLEADEIVSLPRVIRM